MKRTSDVVRRAGEIPKEEVDNLWSQHLRYERGVFQSLKSFVQVNAAMEKEAGEFYSTMEKLTGKPSTGTRSNATSVYKRNASIKGPLSVFGYDYLADHLGEEKVGALRLPGYHGLWGDEYAYETLNFVDGRRSTEEIRNAVSAEFGPIPLEVVEEYLRALENAGVIVKQK
ncbi:MAG: PqqD family protein [Bacteroidetes bacterium]|nr:PqqD family protein [Bacteroidota bacterium]